VFPGAISAGKITVLIREDAILAIVDRLGCVGAYGDTTIRVYEEKRYHWMICMQD